jgi:hypothetical protein
MYIDILRRIAGIEVFPVVSLLLFVTVFAVVLVWTARLDAARITQLAALPLDVLDPAARADTAVDSTPRSLS